MRSMGLRLAALLVTPLLLGCPRSELMIERPAGTGMVLVDVWSAPSGDVFVVGARREQPGRILHRHQGSWSSLEVASMPTSVWGTSDTDVYVGAEEAANPDDILLHWDGTSWSAMGSSVPGDATPLTSVSDIFGSGPDDMWLLATRSGTEIQSVFHWDGALWTEHPSTLWDLEPYTFFHPTYGCRPDSESVWIAGVYLEYGAWTSGLSYHWDGVLWTKHRFAQASNPGGLACRGDQIWATGKVDNDFHSIFSFEGGAWTEVYNTLDDFGVGDIPNFKGVWIDEDHKPRIVGGMTSNAGATSDLMIWRVQEGQLETKAKGGEGRGRLIAVTVDAEGTLWAVGENGLVVQLPGE